MRRRIPVPVASPWAELEDYAAHTQDEGVRQVLRYARSHGPATGIALFARSTALQERRPEFLHMLRRASLIKD